MTRWSPDDMWWQRCNLSKETKCNPQLHLRLSHYYKIYPNASP